jgi:hypothetical protein
LLKDTTTLTVEEALIQAAKKEINQQCEIHQGKQILKGQIVGIKVCEWIYTFGESMASSGN